MYCVCVCVREKEGERVPFIYKARLILIKNTSMNHPMRIKLTNNGLPNRADNHYIM